MSADWMSQDPLAAADAPPPLPPRSPPPWPAQGAEASGLAGQGQVATGGRDLAALVWKGQFLTVVTLGIYRFWYKTDLRRWYWRGTIVDGSAFEYRGTAKELFIGFLIALAVVVPLYGAVALAGLFAGEAAGIAANVLFALIFLLLVQYGAYRSRRYRLTRTVWRGIRFDQTGSGWAYAAKSLVWALAVVVTVGLAFPLMRRALEAHKIRRTRFGTAEGRFDASIGRLMGAWLLVVGPLALCLALGAAAMMTGGAFEGVAPVAAAVTALVLGSLALIWAILLWPLYRIREFRIFAEGTAIGPVTFRSDAAGGAAYGIYGKFFLVSSVVTSAFGVAAAAAIAAGGGPAEAFSGPRSWAVLAALALIYLGGFLALGVLKELMLNQPFWRLLAGTLTLSGLDRLDEVLAASVAAESAAGEGFGDALDFGGI